MLENEKESSSSQNCGSHSVGKRGLTYRYLHLFWTACQREKIILDRQKRKRELIALKNQMKEQIDAHHSQKKMVEEKRLSSLMKRVKSYEQQIKDLTFLSEAVCLLILHSASVVWPFWRGYVL